jgi:molybdate transport system permease protein
MSDPAWLSAAEWTAVVLSLEVGALATIVVAPPGIALGWLLARRDFPGKILVDALVHLPLVLTPVVVGYLLLLAFGRRSPVGAWLAEHGVAIAFAFPGAVLAAAVVALPLMVRSVRTAVSLVDPGLEQAAATLGAGPWRRFATITLPLAMPGVIAGLVLAFARSLGEFGATITLAGSIPGETRTLPIAIYGATQVPDGDAEAMRLTIVSVVISMAALVASEAIDRHLRRRAGR